MEARAKHIRTNSDQTICMAVVHKKSRTISLCQVQNCTHNTHKNPLRCLVFKIACLTWCSFRILWLFRPESCVIVWDYGNFDFLNKSMYQMKLRFVYKLVWPEFVFPICFACAARRAHVFAFYFKITVYNNQLSQHLPVFLQPTNLMPDSKKAMYSFSHLHPALMYPFACKVLPQSLQQLPHDPGQS